MGTWDVGGFDNDDALDWVYELKEESDFTILADAFENITGQKGNLEAPDCAVAISAAEVVAALLGNPADDLPDEVIEWVEEMPDPSEALVKMALSAVKVILDDSEMKDTWEDSDHYDEWQENIQDLQSRLSLD